LPILEQVSPIYEKNYREATELQCIHTHKWPIVQKTEIQKPQGNIQLLADQKFECYDNKGNIDVGRLKKEKPVKYGKYHNVKMTI